MTKHYIRINENSHITKVFSDKFENPEKDDICINENGGRHFHLDIFTPENEFKYKWHDKKIVERTDEETNSVANLKKRKIIEIQNNRQQAENIYNMLKKKIEDNKTFDEIENEIISVINNASSKGEIDNIEWER